MSNIKTFEVSKRKTKNGRRKFKAILHEVYPDSCIDEAKGVGVQMNNNGITWIRRYCEAALPSIKDMSCRVEFLDDERTEICGHGETDIVDDGFPVFEDAEVIGHFTDGYIDEIEDDNGNMKTVCIGVGYLDEMCYKNFISKLSEDVENGNAPNGSIEIYRTDDNDCIKYLYGYKENGRIPTEFIYSGYAILSVTPADKTAKILELNNKEDLIQMTENEIKSIVSQVVDEMTLRISEIDKYKDECEAKILEANKCVDDATKEKNEAVEVSEKIQVALDECKSELEDTYKKIDSLYEEMEVLRKELGAAKAKERIDELSAAISDFSEEEKSYAQSEIDAFNENPVESEINSVVNKIWEGIGRNAKANEKIVSEQNSLSEKIEDIFGEIVSTYQTEEINIF